MNDFSRTLYELELDRRRLKRTQIVLMYRLVILYYLIAGAVVGGYLTYPYEITFPLFLGVWVVFTAWVLLYPFNFISEKSCSYNAELAHWVMGRYFKKYDPELRDFMVDPYEKPTRDNFQRWMRCLTGASTMRPF